MASERRSGRLCCHFAATAIKRQRKLLVISFSICRRRLLNTNSNTTTDSNSNSTRRADCFSGGGEHETTRVHSLEVEFKMRARAGCCEPACSSYVGHTALAGPAPARGPSERAIDTLSVWRADGILARAARRAASVARQARLLLTELRESLLVRRPSEMNAFLRRSNGFLVCLVCNWFRARKKFSQSSSVARKRVA